jgi:hypothetical protein
VNQHKHLGIVDAAQRDSAEIADANADSHPDAMDGTSQHDTFAVKFHAAHAAVRAEILRIEADGKREGVEPQCATRPGGIDPACCSLTPHGFVSPPGLFFPVDARRCHSRVRFDLKRLVNPWSP